MAKLLVMTDPHLVAPGGTIIGLDPLQRFRDGLEHAAQMHPDAERLIVMGDLTNDGDPEAYEALLDALESVPWAVTLMMGNHDDRGVFRTAFPSHPTDSKGFIQSFFDIEDMRLITLDSLDEASDILHAGRLCEERLGWLRAALETDRRCLVFVHHPPFDTGFKGMDGISLQDRDAFFQTLADGNVAYIFAGHVHRTISASVRGYPITIFKSTCHQMPMLLGQEGFGHSVDEPGAYGIVLVNEADVVVHFEDFSLPDQANAQFDARSG